MKNSKIAGIVAEYNPFHSGHAYQIAATRKAGATHICVVMSGNFVQRGGPAALSKFLRADCAVCCGADLVLELPLPGAMATAQRFAAGALTLLRAMGCVDLLSFGSESGDLDRLERAALAVADPECAALTKELLQTGISYAAARQSAVALRWGEETAASLATPNDTLGVAYLEQNNVMGRPFQPMVISRQGAVHDSGVPERFASASFLRERILEGGVEAAAVWLPQRAAALMSRAEVAGLLPFRPHSLDTAVLCALRRMNKADFLSLPDISEGLEGRLFRAAREARSLEEFFTLAKTKRYPLARLRRGAWNAFLGVDKELLHTPPPYLRVLSMNVQGAEILSQAKKRASLPLSSSLKELEKLGGMCARYAELEARATDLYGLGLPRPQTCGGDYTHRLYPLET